MPNLLQKFQEFKQFLIILKQKNFRHPDNNIYLSRFILISAAIIGVAVALLVMALKSFIFYTYKFIHFNEIKRQYIIFYFLPILGFLISAILIKKVFSKYGYKTGLGQIFIAIAQNKSKLPIVQIFSQIFTSGATIGFGGSLGIETPSVVMGASLGSNYGIFNRLRYKERTLLLCCGVAASISAAFNAPIAGFLFALEILTLEISVSAFTPILVSAAIASLMVEFLLPEDVIFKVYDTEHNHLNTIHYYIILGLLCGLVSRANSLFRMKLEHIFNNLNWHYIVKAIIGGLIFSGILFLFPALFSDGYPTIFRISTLELKKIFADSFLSSFSEQPLGLIFLMVGLMFFKPIACALTFGSGGEGGNFAPSLFIGACLGATMGLLLNYFGIVSVSIVALALAGMAGILAGTYYAPLTAIFLITEMTGGYSFVVPLIFVVSCSYAIAKYWEPYPVEIAALVKKGVIYSNDLQKNILTTEQLKDFIDEPKLVLTTNQTFREISHLITNSDLIVYPVLNEAKNKLEGLIYFENIRIFLLDEATDIIDWPLWKIMTMPNHTCYPDTQVNDIMNIFDKFKSWVIPITNKDGSFVGFVYKYRILERFRKNINSSSIIN